MSDLCKCGHDERFHGSPDDGSVICGLCMAICKQPPTADRDDLVAILAKHRFRRHASAQQRNGSYRQQPRGCECWHWEGDEDAHRAHVAQMVLESDWLRGVKADVWDTCNTHWFDWTTGGFTKPTNPYRADRVDAEDGKD